ncbi:MAG: ferredoxin, partial [Gammaproteobacteria bacterium]|nr:ferredoxin [Gammaproteobacteria bacterium]
MNSLTENKHDEVDPPGPEGENGLVTIDVLRRFHYGEPHAAASTAGPAPTILPALLNPYRDASTIRYQYPIYLLPPGAATADALATPLGEYLNTSLQALAPGTEDARILKDNLPWVERYLRQALDGPDPVDAPELFDQAAAALRQHLDLEPASQDSLDADIEKLKGTFDAGGQFLGYGPRVSIHLMVHAIRHRREQIREQFCQQLVGHIHRLQSLLNVEKSKSAAANEPGSVKSSVGPGSRYFDAGALSGVLEQRAHGSVEMSTERRNRVERALKELQDWQEDPVLVRFIGQLDDPWFRNRSELELVDSEDPCTTAAETFERDARE